MCFVIILTLYFYVANVSNSLQMIMDEKMLSRIWSSFTIKAFCRHCEHFDLVEEGDFLKLVEHLETHETLLLKEEADSKEVPEFKTENIEEVSEDVPISYEEEEPFVISFVKSEKCSDYGSPPPGKKITKKLKIGKNAKWTKIDVVVSDGVSVQKRKKVRRNKAEIEFEGGFETSDEEDCEGVEELTEINWSTVGKEISYPWKSIWSNWNLDSDSSRKIWKCNFCVHEYLEKDEYIKKKKDDMKRLLMGHTKKFHLDRISEMEREGLLAAKKKKSKVFKKIRKDFNLSQRGPVVDPETQEIMHIRKFMFKLIVKEREKEKERRASSFISIFENFTKDLMSSKSYICNLCKDTVVTTSCRGNARPDMLFEHMQNYHDLYKDVQRHLCQDCGAVYMSEGSLALHIRLKHTKFKYFCPYEDCKKGFNLKGEQMEQHIRTHTGERPHLCTICGQGFNSKQNLKDHVALHKGESKFVCKYCQRQFAKGIYLKNHERTHTGERPFKCAECGKAFVQKIHLTTHIRGVHGK